MASLFPRHLWKLLFGDLHDFSLHSWIAQGILAERFVCFWRAWGVWICWICVPKPWGKTRKKTWKTTWTPWKKSGLQPTINPVQFFMFCIAQAGKPSLMSFPTQPKPSGSSWPAFFTASCTFQITSWSEIHDSRFFGSKCLFQNGEPDRGAIWRPPTLSRSIVPKHFVLSLIISIKRKIVLNVLDMCVCLNCGPKKCWFSTQWSIVRCFSDPISGVPSIELLQHNLLPFHMDHVVNDLASPGQKKFNQQMARNGIVLFLPSTLTNSIPKKDTLQISPRKDDPFCKLLSHYHSA